jgi:hypothetical protein
MKNSPDPEWFNRFEQRLRDYTESPDAELWDKISASVGHYQEPLWIPWTNRLAAAMVVLAFAWLWMPRSVENSDSKTFENINKPDKFEIKKEAASTQDNDLENIPSRQQDDGTFTRLSKTPTLDHFRAQAADVSSAKKYSVNGMQATPPSVFVNRDVEKSTSENIFPKEQNNATQEKMITAETPEELIPTVMEKDSLAETLPLRTEKEKKKEKKNRVIIGYASIAPTLSYQKVTPLKNDGVVVDHFDSKSIFSGNRLGINLEVGIQLLLSKRLEMYGGMSLYQQSQKLSYQAQSNGSNQAKQQIYFDYNISPGSIDEEIRYNMLNVGTQAGLIYHLKGTKLAHKIGGGFAYQRGLQTVAEGVAYSNYDSHYLFYQVFYRNEFSVSHALKIFVQPFYARSFYTKEKLDAPFTLKPSRAGLSFGVVYRFD